MAEQPSDASSAYAHPDFAGFDLAPRSDPHDVGVVILDEPVQGITPVDLPTPGYLDQLKASGQLRPGPNAPSFTVVGYGSEILWPPPQQSVLGIRRYAYSAYQNLHPAWLKLSQNQAQGNGGTCGGDGGGPTFWVDDTGAEVLVALISTGDIACVSSAWNYRIDTAESLDFINQAIDDNP